MLEPVITETTREALELPSLLALIAHRCASDLGHRRLLELVPFVDEEQLREHRLRHDEARRLVAAAPLVPYLEREIRPLLSRLERGGHDLDGRDLSYLGTLLEISGNAHQRIVTADPEVPGLAALAEGLPSLEDLRTALRRTFDARGEIRENATPLLAELRGRLRRVRQEIYNQLSSWVGEHQEHLSEDTIPLRGGRLVVMLQAGARGRAQGLIHGRSSRGKSFYFEPLDAVENNNTLLQTADDEAAEKRRILAELMARLRCELPAIEAHAGFVTELDRLQAAVRFAEVSGGRLADLAPRHEARLLGARHPLLDPVLGELRREALGTAGHTDPIVPLDLELSGRRRALVITGPNAGGKTVALKTLGLLAAAHQCGLPIPAAPGSQLPFLRRIVAAVGDDQDLLADRSTFSGRLLRLREAWEAAGADSLVLVDELGSGTDPEEGAALATALLEGLVARRCLTLITTHLSRLAVAALETDDAFCAAMLFDTAGGRPTYRLLPGPPGGSEALALARRLDLPGEWLDRAEVLLGSEHRDLRRLLAELEHTRGELAEASARLETELADATRLRQRLAEQEAALADERKTLAPRLQRQLQAFREETQKRLHGELETLRRELEAGRRKGLASAAAERLFAPAPDFAPPEEPGETAAVEVGSSVRHRRLGWVGVVEKLERGRALVRAQGKSLRCRQEDLAAVAETADAARPARRSRLPPPSPQGATIEQAAAPPPELKLIGERVEPALETLDRFLDRALLAAHPAVRIIHGHGSGRLRAAVRRHLRGHPAVASQRPGGAREGGDGATVAELQGA